MRRVIFLSLAVLATVCAANAQNGGISSQVEITKEYTPSLSTVSKLVPAPQGIDSVMLKPAMEYSVRPKSMNRSYRPMRLSPASINASQYSILSPCFVQVAVGYPLQTQADIYCSLVNYTHGSAGFAFNHDGVWAGMKNDFDVRTRARSVKNAMRGYWSYDFDSGLRLSVDAGANSRIYRPYGGFRPDDFDVETLDNRYVLADSTRLSYTTVEGGVRFGDTFTDLSHFNFEVELRGEMFYNRQNGYNYYSRTEEQSNYDLGKIMANLRGARELGPGVLQVAVSTHYLEGNQPKERHRNTISSLKPKYTLNVGNWNIMAGLDVVYDHYYRRNTSTTIVHRERPDTTYSQLYLFPQALVYYELIPGKLHPYVRLNGGLESSDPKTLSELNPYLSYGTRKNNQVRYSTGTGIAGAVRSIFNYDLHANASFVDYYNYFLNYYYMPSAKPNLIQSTRFISLTRGKALLFDVGLDVNAQLGAGVSVDFSGKYTVARDGEKNQTVSARYYGIPKVELSGGVRYTARDKFSLRLGADYTGVREFMSFNGNLTQSFVTNTVAATLNLNVQAEWRMDERMAFYLTGDNLLNQRIYTYNYYRALGANVMIGVRARF